MGAREGGGGEIKVKTCNGGFVLTCSAHFLFVCLFLVCCCCCCCCFLFVYLFCMFVVVLFSLVFSFALFLFYFTVSLESDFHKILIAGLDVKDIIKCHS